MIHRSTMKGERDAEVRRTDRHPRACDCSFSERTADARADELQVHPESGQSAAVRLTRIATISTGDPALDQLAHGVALDHLRRL